MASGYIKIFRDIHGHWLFRSPRRFNQFEAWVDLLLLAAFQKHKVHLRGQLYEVNRGDVLYSQRELAKRWRWSEKKLRNFLRLLENDGMIVVHALLHRVTQINICNYERWQGLGCTGAPSVSHGEDEPRKRSYRRTKKDKNGEESVSFSKAAEIYRLYAEKIRPAARSDTIRNIERLLNKGYSAETLAACVVRYTNNGMPTDIQFRIQGNNFFGQKERFKDYLPEVLGEGQSAAGPTAAERFFGEEQ